VISLRRRIGHVGIFETMPHCRPGGHSTFDLSQTESGGDEVD
jgi:hypothetical protein